MSPRPAEDAQFGPYRLIERIGKGGMGEVWRARDTRLDREVAVKISAEQFTDRFDREARAIAALNHPNICTLHDVGPNYLVMELIDGSTLADRIAEGPIPLRESLAIAKQIAEALQAAHEKNIVHRDLKPGNIKLGPNGRVKVLDFGLAKSGTPGMPLSEESPTMAMSTQIGVILGTAGYMAPEQAKGKSVDKRADIWSFGVVLYEMLTAKRAFQGDSVTEILGAVIHKQPDLSKIPPQARRLVERCLDKDPATRLRDLGDWEHLLESDTPPVALSPGSNVPRRIWIRKIALWAIPAALMLAIGMGALWFRPTPPMRTTRFQVSLPENVYFDSQVSVSPDGQNLLFNATGDQGGLWIHNLATLQWQKLPGTENASSPFWSPDSRFLAFLTYGWDSIQVKKTAISGGTPTTVYTVQGRALGGGTWGQSGDFLIGGVYGRGTVWQFSPHGGPAIPLTSLAADRAERAHTDPAFLPDGKHFLYFMGGPESIEGVYAGLVNAKPENQPRERIVASPVFASYVDGKLLYMRDGAVIAQPFDPDRLRLTGSPVRLVEHVETIYSVGVFSASAGVLAYRSGTAVPGYLLTWVDRHGKEIGTSGQPNFDGGVRLSPDNGRAATVGEVSDGDRTATIWVLDFARDMRTRFTLEGAAESPVWSPDGSQIFYSSGGKLETISVKAASGVGDGRELLNEAGKYHYPSGISPDGRFLIYYTTPRPQGPGVSGETWALPLRSAGQPIHLLGGRFSENRAVISPDGRWIAYRSNESGQFEVYVRNIVTSANGNLSLGEGKWQASKGTVAADLPVWRHDSKELFYMSEQKVVFSVGLNAGSGALRLSSPEALFTRPCSCAFDVSDDGQKFLVRGANGADGRTPITVVLNWQADLKGK
jgi:serine/threonine protein kinase